jgi:hypothetical protein
MSSSACPHASQPACLLLLLPPYRGLTPRKVGFGDKLNRLQQREEEEEGASSQEEKKIKGLKRPANQIAFG